MKGGECLDRDLVAGASSLCDLVFYCSKSVSESALKKNDPLKYIVNKLVRLKIIASSLNDLLKQ
jgi:hypothetical protein